MRAARRLLLVAVLACGAAATLAHAQGIDDLSDGEVRKVDRQGKKLTLKHGEIKNLGMPPMAMVFQVQDAAMLDKIKSGDKVRFRAVFVAGKYIATEIRPAK
jgi:Cu(I)/Ag(I) efflux system protein CusF